MKIFVALLLVAVVNGKALHGETKLSQRASFDDNLNDFLQVIAEEKGDVLDNIIKGYQEEEDFQKTITYLSGSNFQQILSEMEHLDEFVAVFEYIEKDNIDIYYYLNKIHELLGVEITRSAPTRHSDSGFNAFLRDIIDNLPKDSLVALFNEKLENDEEFKSTVTKLQSEEFHAIFNDLWTSEKFTEEIVNLDENGVNVHLVVEAIKAVFGQ